MALEQKDSQKLRFTLLYNQHQARISFQDKVLEWDLSSFIPSSFRGEFDLFEQLNRYIDRMTLKQQEAMFESYVDIYNVFNRQNEIERAILALRPIVTELVDMFDERDLTRWVETGSDNKINIPSSFMEEFSTDPNKVGGRRIIQGSTPEMTYLRGDYIVLVGGALICRAMLPIWGAFIYKLGGQAGTLFKELEAGRLLEGSKFTKSESYKKLQKYMDSYVKFERIKGPGQLEGLSSEDLRDWVLNLILVRRVSIGDIRGMGDANTHLVSSIHNYIKNRINSYDTNFSHGRITSKTPKRSSDDANERASVLEAFRINYTFSPGTLEEFSVYAEDTEAIIETLCPHLDRAVLKQAFDNSQILLRSEISVPQIYIAGWVLGPYLHPRTLMYLTQINTVHILSIVQAILWTHGFKELAIFLTCTQLKKTDAMRLSGFGSRSSIPRAVQDKLTESYPYTRRPNGPIPNPRTESIQNAGIKSIVSLIQESNWEMNCHPSWIAQMGYKSQVAGHAFEFHVPNDIRTQLAQLAIKIASEPRPFATPIEAV